MSRKGKDPSISEEPRTRLDPKVVEGLVTGPLTTDEFNALVNDFKKAVMERALGAELTHHLGYAKDEAKPGGQSNHRNGSSPKSVTTETGKVDLEVPRDREGSFERVLVGKHERRFTGFDDKILAMYSRGMTVREIQAYLLEMYTVEVSPALISEVTDAVIAEVQEWHRRDRSTRSIR